MFVKAVWVNRSQTRMVVYDETFKKLTLLETYPHIVKIPKAERKLKIK